MDPTARGILDFWIDEVGTAAWFRADDALDATIRDRYGALWESARTGACDAWTDQAHSCLALAILLDQFPRNMFRDDDPRAFATDARAQALARDAVERGLDLEIAPPGRLAFYLPLLHSEAVEDQDLCLRLMEQRLDAGGMLLHARAHRLAIQRFGRFPHRNAALGRETTAAEQAFLDAGGYAAAVAEVRES
jgi:uncharacterized protein (DUF924 family)